MQINQLKYAVQVARLLSFSKAADKLCVTQPALSHQIQKLEEEIGVSLFERKTRTVRLTYAGEIFVAEAEKILGQLDGLRQSMQEIRMARTGSIRVGTTSTQIVPGLFTYLASFRERYPNVQVHIVETAGSLSLTEMLTGGEVDAAFLIASADDMRDERICYFPLIRGQVLLAVSETHRLAERPSVSLRDLQGESFIFPGRALSMHAIALRLCRENGFEPRILCECDQVDTVLGFVASGNGIGFVSSQSLMMRPLAGIRVIPVEPLVERVSSLAVAAGKNGRPIVEMFREYLLQAISPRAHKD